MRQAMRFLGTLALVLTGAWVIGYMNWGLRALFAAYPGQTWGGMMLAVATPFLIMLVNRTAAVLAVDRHVEQCRWDPVAPGSREWPWTDLRLRGAIRVARAWSFESEGYPVTAGEVRWSGNALAGAVVPRRGKGVFVVVELPAEVPPMAMRNRFDRIGDSPLLLRAELRLALLNDRIPPWTARGRTLFTVEVPKSWITPSEVDRAVRRALHVVELLGLSGEDLTCP